MVWLVQNRENVPFIIVISYDYKYPAQKMSDWFFIQSSS